MRRNLGSYKFLRLLEVHKNLMDVVSTFIMNVYMI